MAQMFLDPHLDKHCKTSKSPSCRILGAYFLLLGVDFLAPCGTSSVFFYPFSLIAWELSKTIHHHPAVLTLSTDRGRFPGFRPGTSRSVVVLHANGEGSVLRLAITLPKFNSSPLKNDGWKTTFPFGFRSLFRGELLNFRWVDLFASWLTSSFE